MHPTLHVTAAGNDYVRLSWKLPSSDRILLSELCHSLHNMTSQKTDHVTCVYLTSTNITVLGLLPQTDYVFQVIEFQTLLIASIFNITKLIFVNYVKNEILCINSYGIANFNKPRSKV